MRSSNHTFPRPPRSWRGFTLVELLVVIGIIALLIGILVPALSSARRQSRTVQCLSNVRQLGIAFLMYTNENKGKTPWFPGFLVNSSTDPHDWITLFRPGYAQIDALRFCPEADEQSAPPEPAAAQVDPGRATVAWRFTTPNPSEGGLKSFAGSYAYNGHLFRDKTSVGDPNRSGDFQTTWGIPFSRLFLLPESQSDRIPIFADGIWFGAWPHSTDLPPANIEFGELNSGMGRVCVNRHSKKRVNVVFLDGHAETAQLSNLWRMRWHREWVNPMPLPQP